MFVDIWTVSIFIYVVDKYKLFEILCLLLVPVRLLRLGQSVPRILI